MSEEINNLEREFKRNKKIENNFIGICVVFIIYLAYRYHRTEEIVYLISLFIIINLMIWLNNGITNKENMLTTIRLCQKK